MRHIIDNVYHDLDIKDRLLHARQYPWRKVRAQNYVG